MRSGLLRLRTFALCERRQRLLCTETINIRSFGLLLRRGLRRCGGLCGSEQTELIGRAMLSK